MRLPENIEQVLIHHGKIAAIKALREAHGLDLREAKEWVESHEGERQPVAATPKPTSTPAPAQARPAPSHQAGGLPVGRVLLAVIVVGGACLGYALATGML